MPTLTVHTVRATNDARGRLVTHTMEDVTGTPVPFRIHRRRNVAFRLGLALAKTLPREDSTLIAITVSTTTAHGGRMALASWRAMPSLPGPFTGTHDVHPLAEMTMRGETFGQYLNRVAAV